MNVAIIKQKEKEVVMVEGAVDLYSSPKLREAILKLTGDKTDPLVINMEKVEYIDSSGVATLVEALQSTKKYNGSVILVNISDKVKDVLELAHLNTIFTMVSSYEEAFK